MEKNFKLGVIGAGFMSSAIISGILRLNVLDKNKILVSDVSEEKLFAMKEKGVAITTDNLFLANNCEFVLFAIKPQDFMELATKIADCNCNKLISIMAGVKIEKIKSIFERAKVARCMPNTPCAIGSGAIGIDADDFEKEDVKFINDIFSPCGEVLFTKEQNLNAITAISGSAPAYFYYFIRSLVKCGIEYGINEQDAKRIATATMIGSGKMINTCQEKSLDDLISAVCSKGGTTIEAMKVFDEKNLNSVIKDAVQSCVNRAGELEKL